MCTYFSGLKYFLNADWFDVVSSLLRETGLATTHVEKISILLQRLSAFR